MISSQLAAIKQKNFAGGRKEAFMNEVIDELVVVLRLLTLSGLIKWEISEEGGKKEYQTVLYGQQDFVGRRYSLRLKATIVGRSSFWRSDDYVCALELSTQGPDLDRSVTLTSDPKVIPGQKEGLIGLLLFLLEITRIIAEYNGRPIDALWKAADKFLLKDLD